MKNHSSSKLLPQIFLTPSSHPLLPTPTSLRGTTFCPAWLSPRVLCSRGRLPSLASHLSPLLVFPWEAALGWGQHSPVALLPHGQRPQQELLSSLHLRVVLSLVPSRQPLKVGGSLLPCLQPLSAGLCGAGLHGNSAAAWPVNGKQVPRGLSAAGSMLHAPPGCPHLSHPVLSWLRLCLLPPLFFLSLALVSLFLLWSVYISL